MKSIGRDEFDAMVRGAEMLLTDRDGPTVYRSPDGEIVKLLRIKRLLSSNLLFPHAVRFARNAAKLAAATEERAASLVHAAGRSLRDFTDAACISGPIISETSSSFLTSRCSR